MVETKTKNSFFYISHGKELFDNLSLIEMIKQSGIIRENTVLVNCNPDYSSSLVQLVNHKLSYLNNNELFERIDLEVPQEGMSQVWNRVDQEYQAFGAYSSDWVRRNIVEDYSYVFISSFVTNFRHYRNLQSILAGKKVAFATTYLEEGSDWKPTFHVEQFKKPILFEWQNSNKIV